MLDNAGDFVLLGGSDLAEYQNKPGQPRPSFPKIQKANQDSEKPAGEWNEANIFVKTVSSRSISTAFTRTPGQTR